MAERPIISSPVVRKAPKVVRVVVPDDDDDGGADSNEENDVNEVNIVMSATIKSSPTKGSPRKRDSMAALLNLDEELRKAADAKRRASDYVGTKQDADHDHNLASIVASLRRQNEDLRAKLDAQASSHANTSLSSARNDAEMRRLAERECEELRTTVTKLDRLLNIEREERSQSEAKTLELVNETKSKWQRKEEAKLAKYRADLQAANTVVQDLEVELIKTQSSLDAANRDNEVLNGTKQCLKAKLNDCSKKLVNTASKYEEKAKALEALEQKYNALEKVTNEAASESSKKKRRTTLSLHENRAELEAIKQVVEKMKDKRSGLESELLEAQSKSDVMQRKVDLLEKEKKSLSKEYEAHLVKCEESLQKLKSETAKWKSEAEAFEDKALALETKLSARDRKISDLEKVMEAIENKAQLMTSASESTLVDSDRRADELQEALDKLQEDFRLQKVELRIADRKATEEKERVGFLREMLKEERDKVKKIEGASHSEAERISQLEKELSSERLERQRHEEGSASARERLARVKSELEALRKDQESAEEYAEKCYDLEAQLVKKDKELGDLASLRKNYQLTKTVCFELEDQIKEYERCIEKMESSQERLRENNTELKGKSDKGSAELITLRGELNEAKSLAIFKDSQIKDLEENVKDLESNVERWRTRYGEVSDVQKDQSSTMLELKDALVAATDERDRAHEMNTYLSDQNTKLKEESATLITGIQSLKDSNMMLQGSVRELAEKLARRDQEIERQATKIGQLNDEMHVKDTEHKTTLDQLKKLTQHMPDRTPKKDHKKQKSTTFANLLL